VCSGFGDLQCSVRAILAFDSKGSQFTDAVINVSTSAQVAFVMPPEFKPSKWGGGKIDPVQYFPYMQGYLAVAASLTGGNALAAFVQTIQDNLGLGSLTRSLCRGLVENLGSMLSGSQLQEVGINRLLGSGGALTRNPVLQYEVSEVYQLPLTMVGEREACLGAALAIFDRHCAPQATVNM